MSIYGSSSSWADQCTGAGQSPINLSQSSSKPCDLMCELTFDDAYISQANVIVSDEGLILQSQTGLGSCKFAGESFSCQTLLVTHPSHHTVENIQADAEVIAIFSNPTSGYLCVSSMIRVNPTQTSSSHFFNAFVPYANPSVESISVSLGEQWGLFMMVPPAGSYFVYDGSMVVPPCQQTKWVVFKSMINIDSNDFALLVKNVVAGSRPIQQQGNRDVFFNDIDQLPGGPMPHDGKTYMRCKRSGRKHDVKDIKNLPLGDENKKQESKKKNYIHEWVSKQIEINGFLELFNVLCLIISLIAGIYYGYQQSKGPYGMYLILAGQSFAKWIRGFFIKTASAPSFTSESTQ
jgi:carbonic anhydrase